MNLVKDTSKCCGCNLCSVVCTHNAISMEPDRYGYLCPPELNRRSVLIVAYVK